jgi:hypothetical protein
MHTYWAIVARCMARHMGKHAFSPFDARAGQNRAECKLTPSLFATLHPG